MQQKRLHLALKPREKEPVLLRTVVEALSCIPLLSLLPIMLYPVVNPLPRAFPHPLLQLLFALAAASSDASQLLPDSDAAADQ